MMNMKNEAIAKYLLNNYFDRDSNTTFGVEYIDNGIDSKFHQYDIWSIRTLWDEIIDNVVTIVSINQI